MNENVTPTTSPVRAAPSLIETIVAAKVEAAQSRRAAGYTLSSPYSPNSRTPDSDGAVVEVASAWRDDRVISIRDET